MKTAGSRDGCPSLKNLSILREHLTLNIVKGASSQLGQVSCSHRRPGFFILSVACNQDLQYRGEISGFTYISLPETF